jgi:VanZ like protein
LKGHRPALVTREGFWFGPETAHHLFAASDDPDDRVRFPGRHLLVASLYLALLLPWLVMDLGWRPHPRSFLLEFRLASSRRLVSDAIFNVAMFVPFGWLLGRGIEDIGASARARIVVVAATSVMLSLTVETVQFFLVSRYSSAIDVLSNTAGAVLGAVVAQLWHRD